MEHDLQKQQKVPDRNYRTTSRSKKAVQAFRRKKKKQLFRGLFQSKMMKLLLKNMILR